MIARNGMKLNRNQAPSGVVPQWRAIVKQYDGSKTNQLTYGDS